MDWLLKLGKRHTCFPHLKTDKLTRRKSILCGDYGIKQVDEPFIHATDNKEEWAI